VAVEAGFSPQTISDLIKLGCDINARNVDDKTPLHAALLNENEEVFKQLAGHFLESQCQSSTFLIDHP